MMLLAAPAANAQSLLDKAKEKAEAAAKAAAAGALKGAVSKAVGSAADKIEQKVEEKVTGTISEKTGMDINTMKNVSENGLPMPDSRQTLQPRRSSSFGWDGVITPSTASYPIPLMNEFPAVPTAAQLASPTEEAQIAYYKAIKAVTLRAEELNEDTTCEDAFTEQWRAEAEKALQDAYGITDAEMKALQDGSLSPEAEEALTDRMRAKILGGIDENQLMEEAKKAEGMTEADINNAAMAASFAVFDKYDAQLRKYFGCTAEEYKKVTKESMNGNEAAARAIEKQTDDHIKTLDAATQKEAKAFKDKLQKEVMQATMNAIPGANLSLNVAKNMQEVQKQLSPLMEKYQKIQKYGNDIMAAWPTDTWSDADAKFSDAERKKVEAIKAKIYASSDPKEYNPLYLQAMEIIKTYRERAAAVWAADVQNRFAKVKEGMGDIIKIQRQAVEYGVIPECALWRAPLNLVIEAGDILAEAYSEFPSNYPHMYSEEVVRQISLQKGESPWWPEFYVSSIGINELFAGNHIFKEVDGVIYQFNKGKWNPVPKDYGKDFVATNGKPVSASWKSSDGKREVVFNAEGGFIQLPEGDIIYPAAWEKVGNEIVWAENQTTENEDGTLCYKVVKCTYKL